MDVNIIEVNNILYGVPTTSLCEVLDRVPITPLPFAPDFVDGMVNISGSVMVQLDLALRLKSGAPMDPDSGQLAVIESGGEKSVLHIDKALLMVSVADNEIHNTVEHDEVLFGKDAEHCLDTAANLVIGDFRWQERTVLLLAVDQLGLNALSLTDNTSIAAPARSEGLVAQVTAADTTESLAVQEPILRSYLVVVCHQERYALPMENVDFVDDLAEVTVLPHAPSSVVGMAYTQNHPYLVLALAGLLGKQTQSQSQRKLIVVQHQGFCCALAVDRLEGIRHLPCQDNHEMLTQDGELAGYLLGDEGQLIGVLNFDVLFSTQRVQTLQRFMVDSQQRKVKKQVVATHSLLTFRVGEEQCALPLAQVERVVEYRQGELTPNGGDQHLHGMVQIQGAVLPVVDLRRQMGLPEQHTPLTAYVVAGEPDNLWALVVDQVNRVLKIAATDLEATSQTDQRYVTAIGRVNNKLVSVIDIASLTAIAAAAAA